MNPILRKAILYRPGSVGDIEPRQREFVGEWHKTGDVSEFAPAAMFALWRQGAIGFYNDKVYMTFGVYGDTGAITGDVWEYDTITKLWTEKTGHPTYGYNAPAFAQNGSKLYIAGGQRYPKDTTTGVVKVLKLLAYDMATDTWDLTLTDVPESGYQSSLCWANGKMYSIGGFNNANAVVGSAYEYDPGTDAWTTKQAAPVTLRTHVAVAGSDGNIYVFGGFHNGVDATGAYKFDPVANTWTSLADSGSIMIPSQSGFFESGVFYIPSPNAPTFRYDQAANTWDTSSSTFDRVAGFQTGNNDWIEMWSVYDPLLRQWWVFGGFDAGVRTTTIQLLRMIEI